MSSPQKGYMLIADITGYTMFLSESELEHAQEILTTLLELLITHTRPPLIISRTAGDAVISYTFQGNALQGQTFVELLEDTYVAFRRAIELMVLNNTCQCAACTNVSALDLKFFLHYGTFMVQRLSALDELVGSDVNLTHRLLKNHVTEATGWRAYTLYTDAAVRHLGIEEMTRQSMTPLTEQYEHLGAVKVWVQDMAPVWQARRDSSRLDIPPDQIIARVESELAAPPHVVWDYLTQPAYRSLLLDAVRQNVLGRQNGRIAPGSQFHCFHGNGRQTMQTVLEWLPFEQMTTEDTSPVPRTTLLINLRLVPTDSGTRLICTASKAKGPFLNRILCDLVAARLLPGVLGKGMAAFRQRLQDETVQMIALESG